MKIYVNHEEWFPVLDFIGYDDVDIEDRTFWEDCLHDLPEEVIERYRRAVSEFKKEHRAMEGYLGRQEAGWAYD